MYRRPMSDDRRVEITGEIDVATAPDMRARLYEAIDARPGGTIIADLAAVEFLDSAGLGVLVAAAKYARAGGGEVQLTMPSAAVWKVFTITGIDTLFEIAI